MCCLNQGSETEHTGDQIDKEAHATLDSVNEIKNLRWADIGILKPHYICITR
jgi:hypothetical protein